MLKFTSACGVKLEPQCHTAIRQHPHCSSNLFGFGGVLKHDGLSSRVYGHGSLI